MWQGVIISSLEQGMVFAVMALGVYITFKILNFADLTVDGSFPLGGAVAAISIVNGVNPFLATLIAFFCGAAAGFVTGFLNTKGKITELLAGILTMTALYSINLRIMGKSNIALLNQKTIFTYMSSLNIPSQYLNIVVFLIILVIIKVLLDEFLLTKAGFALRATGNNPQMIRSTGVDTDFMKIFGVSLSNALIAMSGALVAQYQGFADVGMGIGTIVAGLASVIIGEMIIGGDKVRRATFTVIIGSIIYRSCIAVALNFGFAPTDLKLLTTLLVILALCTPQFKRIFKIASNS